MKNIKFWVGLLLIVLNVAQTLSQIDLSGQVIDQLTKEHLAGARVFTNDQHAVTNLSGNFNLNGVSEKDSVTIELLGFHSTTLPTSALMSQISLRQSQTDLDQIIVSASRDKQRRSSAPVSMSILTATEIDQAKATSADQLVNKTPGVYMVDLGNEQHGMAIRQPLSYKSLFLYLEDGLPIRTTGLFNHNALLEMNMAAFKSIEIIRGPSSALYGSEAIGGAVNFITLQPSAYLRAKISVQANNLGFRRTDLHVSNTIGKTGILVSGNFAFRKNGYRAHSDYEKLALTTKVNHQFSDKLLWKNSITVVDYRADMTGSLDSSNFYGKKYTSLQTFTERDVLALRIKSAFQLFANASNKTDLSLFYRNNSIEQNPSYRIKDDYSQWGNPSGNKNLAHSEVNDNSFQSFGVIAQHKKSFARLKASFIGGMSVDFSPSTYHANYISIYKNNNGVYELFSKTDSILTDYTADMLNTAAYAQFGFNPMEQVKITGAVRYDHFRYKYDNNLDVSAFSGAPDAINYFQTVTPTIGVNIAFNKYIGMYSNYSRGFVPPQVGELYRGVTVPALKPAIFENLEFGSYIQIKPAKLSLDIAAYVLQGINEIISVQQANGEFIDTNAGKTNHLGIEYGLKYNPIKGLNLRASGTNAIHRFVFFEEKGTDLSKKEMGQSPGWIFNSEITYNSPLGFRISAEWQRIDPYFMDNQNTMIYEGFNVFHLRTGYAWNGFEVWLNLMNITNTAYATTARKSAWGTSYNPGDQRTFNVGIQYQFNSKK